MAPLKFIQFLQVFFICALLYYLGQYGNKMPIYVGHNWIVTPFIAFFIYSLVIGNGIIINIFSSYVFVWLGKISYCFYSLQVIIILIIIDHHEKIVALIPALNNNLLLLLVSLILLIIASCISYLIIEEPARKAIQSTIKNKHN